MSYSFLQNRDRFETSFCYCEFVLMREKLLNSQKDGAGILINGEHKYRSNSEAKDG